MKSKTIKKTLLTLGMASMLCCVIQTTSNAGLQAKPGVSSLQSGTANDFFVKIRQMETTGGTLGLNAELEATTYLDKTKNGLDIHMIKNTEWGTIAMLSASVYGLAPSGTSDATTTGNNTGIYQMAGGAWEYTAGIYKDTNDHTSGIKSADPRYRDLYESSVAKTGDGTLETIGWKSSGDSKFLGESYAALVFKRSGTGLFSYRWAYGDNSGARYGGHEDRNSTSRAVVVSGKDL